METERERRESERRAIVRRAIDLHESQCPCNENRRKAQRRASESTELHHAWEWRALERESKP